MTARTRIAAGLRWLADRVDGKAHTVAVSIPVSWERPIGGVEQTPPPADDRPTSGDLGDGWWWCKEIAGLTAVDPLGRLPGWIQPNGAERYLGSIPTPQRHRLREVWAEMEGWRITKTHDEWEPMISVEVPSSRAMGPDIVGVYDASDIHADWPECVRRLASDMLAEVSE